MGRRHYRSHSKARGRSPSRDRRGRSQRRGRAATPPSRSQLLANSWSCRCGFNTNFATRSTCYRCGAPPGQGQAVGAAPSQRTAQQTAARQPAQQATQASQPSQTAPPLPQASPVGPWFQGNGPAATSATPPPGQSAEAEMTRVRAALKSRNEFIKHVKDMLTLNPDDAYYPVVLAGAEREVADLVSRLEALKPVEVRMASCYGALTRKTTLHTKLVADLATMDLARAALALQVDTCLAELTILRAKHQNYSGANVVPTAAITLVQQWLEHNGVGSQFPEFLAHLTAVGLDVAVPPTDPHSHTAPSDTPMGQSPFSPVDPAAAAAAAATAAAGSCFPSAADQAASDRADDMRTRAAAAQVHAEEAFAAAATMSKQAEEAFAQAAAARTQREADQALAAGHAQQGASTATARATAAQHGAASGSGNCPPTRGREAGQTATTSPRNSRSPRLGARSDEFAEGHGAPPTSRDPPL
jgi:hypothetical protein